MTPFLLQCVGCGNEIWHEAEVDDCCWPPSTMPWCPRCNRRFYPPGPAWRAGERKAQAFFRDMQLATHRVLERRAR